MAATYEIPMDPPPDGYASAAVELDYHGDAYSFGITTHGPDDDRFGWETVSSYVGGVEADAAVDNDENAVSALREFVVVLSPVNAVHAAARRTIAAIVDADDPESALSAYRT